MSNKSRSITAIEALVKVCECELPPELVGAANTKGGSHVSLVFGIPSLSLSKSTKGDIVSPSVSHTKLTNLLSVTLGNVAWPAPAESGIPLVSTPPVRLPLASMSAKVNPAAPSNASKQPSLSLSVSIKSGKVSPSVSTLVSTESKIPSLSLSKSTELAIPSPSESQTMKMVPDNPSRPPSSKLSISAVVGPAGKTTVENNEPSSVIIGSKVTELVFLLPYSNTLPTLSITIRNLGKLFVFANQGVTNSEPSD